VPAVSRPGRGDRPDVLASRRPPGEPLLPRPALALCAVCLAAGAGLCWLATHVHGQLARVETVLAGTRSPPRLSLPPAGPPVAPLLSALTRTVPVGAGLSVRITVLAARNPVSGYARVLVAGRVRGGRPDTAYRLVGIVCPAGYARTVPWAAGRTGRSGAATLTGRPFATTVSSYLAAVLLPGHGRSAQPGVQGYFGRGQVTVFPSGFPPCAPVNPPFVPVPGA
jgi:hypothetical protein